MTLIIFILFGILAALLVYALYAMGFLQDVEMKIRCKSSKPIPYAEDEATKLSRQLNSLRKELDKQIADYTALKKEAERAQRNELELQEQILKHKE